MRLRRTSRGLDSDDLVHREDLVLAVDPRMATLAKRIIPQWRLGRLRVSDMYVYLASTPRKEDHQRRRS